MLCREVADEVFRVASYAEILSVERISSDETNIL